MKKTLLKVLSIKNNVAISAIVAAIVILIMILIYPVVEYSPKVMILPQQKSGSNLKPISVDSVALYRYLSASAKPIAIINIEKYAEAASQQDQDLIIDRAKAAAAGLGADGLLLKYAYFKQPGGIEANLSGYVMQFLAVKSGVGDVPAYGEIEEPSIVIPQ